MITNIAVAGCFWALITTVWCLIDIKMSDEISWISNIIAGACAAFGWMIGSGLTSIV